jgi:hypothetical protein
MIAGTAKRQSALCYAQTTRQQDLLAEKLTYTAGGGELEHIPSYLSILARAGLCLVLIIAMIYGINRVMEIWLR